MKKTIASKDGGYDVDITIPEREKIEAEWKKNAEEYKAEEAREAIEKSNAEEALDAITKILPKAQSDALKKKLNL